MTKVIFFPYFCMSILNDMVQIIQLKKEKTNVYIGCWHPLVMDPDVIRANNNYPFKTGEDYVWYIAVDGKEVKGLIRWNKRRRKGCNKQLLCRRLMDRAGKSLVCCCLLL